MVLVIPSLYSQSQFPDLSMAGWEQAISMLEAIVTMLMSPTLWLMWLLFGSLYLIPYNALTANMNWSATGQATSLSNALGVGVRVFPRAFLIGLLIAVIVTLGTMLLMIPGFYWFGTLELSFIALVVEDLGVGASMDASRRLIKGYWWRAVNLFSIVVIIALVASLAADVVISLIAVFAGALSPTTVIVTQLISVFVGTLLAPLFPAALLAMYYDLKLRKEGARSSL